MERLTEGSIVSKNGSLYLVAQVRSSRYMFICENGNRYVDQMFKPALLQAYAEREGFTFIKNGGFHE